MHYSKAMSAVVLLVSLVAIPKVGQSSELERELAEIDAATTMLGSIRSWSNNAPDAAIHAFVHYDAVRHYLERQQKQHSGASGSRLIDRMVQIDASMKTWDEAVEKLHRSWPQQIATELRRQRDAVERYQKSKSPRPSRFAYIPKTVWQTKDKLDVLTASGFETTELVSNQKEVQRLVLDLVATLDAEELAKKNGIVRDAYKLQDRVAMESVVKQIWESEHPTQPLFRVVMPSQSWENTYSAQADGKTGGVVPYEVDRITVFAATERSDKILTLHPFRLAREHYRVNGKRLGKTELQAIERIHTNQFAFDVLKSNVR